MSKPKGATKPPAGGNKANNSNNNCNNRSNKSTVPAVQKVSGGGGSI